LCVITVSVVVAFTTATATPTTTATTPFAGFSSLLLGFLVGVTVLAWRSLVLLLLVVIPRRLFGWLPLLGLCSLLFIIVGHGAVRPVGRGRREPLHDVGLVDDLVLLFLGLGLRAREHLRAGPEFDSGLLLDRVQVVLLLMVVKLALIIFVAAVFVAPVVATLELLLLLHLSFFLLIALVGLSLHVGVLHEDRFYRIVNFADALNLDGAYLA
jgi:hypothetical protein